MTLVPPTSRLGAGSARVLGPFAFTFATPALTAGVALGYTPAVNDVLLDAWIETTTAWDGTTPQADIGPFTGTNTGYLSYLYGPMSLATAFPDIGGGTPQGLRVTPGTSVSPTSMVGAGLSSASPFLGVVPSFLPARFSVASPLLVVVSQTGAKGGAAVGGTAGASRVYLVVATPSAT